jgi:hypothetical protein
MAKLVWSTIVGAAPGTSETEAEGKLLAESLRNVQSHFQTSPHAASALQAHIELQWLALAHQEQASIPGEGQQSRMDRILNSVSERRALQRLSSELFTVLNPTKGMGTSVAGETSHKNQH